MPGNQTLIIFAITTVIAGFWWYWTQIKSSVPKRFLTTLYLFTRRNQVYRIEAENRGGLMFPDKIGSPSYVERQTAALTRRWGRVMNRSKTPAGTDNKRHRERIYIVRENDPTPLTVSLGIAGQYQGEQIKNSEFKDLSNLNQREAAASARIEGSSKDSVANKLMIAVVIAISGAVLAWGAVGVLIIIHGSPTS